MSATDGAERSAHSAVDAGHLDMGNLRSPSVTSTAPGVTPGSGPSPALSSRRGSVETPPVAASRVNPAVPSLFQALFCLYPCLLLTLYRHALEQLLTWCLVPSRNDADDQLPLHRQATSSALLSRLQLVNAAAAVCVALWLTYACLDAAMGRLSDSC